MQSDDDEAGDLTTNGSPYGTEVDEIAKRIRGRDHQLREGVRYWWFATGKDLNEAKARIPHGRFESWCQSLDYSKSKAEKLMRTASMFSDQLESVKVTEFPKPSSLYLLSAPSVPQAIRDEFVPRIIAGQSVGFEVKQAIKTYHADVERSAGSTAKAKAARASPEAANAKAAERDAAKREAQNLVQVKAKAAALDFLAAKLGKELSIFLELAGKAGLGAVLNYGAERELTARMQAVDAQSAEIESTVLPVGNLGPGDVEAPEVHDDPSTSSELVGETDATLQPIGGDASAPVAEHDPDIPLEASASPTEDGKPSQTDLSKSDQANSVTNKLATSQRDDQAKSKPAAVAEEPVNFLFPGKPIRFGASKR
ncbi:DUF3102 domain-containing protein [Methylobacterium bullatum]|uniref:DUF3102 domain-containing protein n=1 Tax=Methylobacterium bullatum TaxID=570505 RepID=A0AAV4ZCL1_9HYPH|nr:DUF3102 domain-containing protein [Methylobacterium bullatum]MBD8904925.1 hypothetical protein [Methylobacterium bullatum]GJD41379.1 hypothetical protein OICFNHDK_3862 [Methylobacterium bullatum]